MDKHSTGCSVEHPGPIVHDVLNDTQNPRQWVCKSNFWKSEAAVKYTIPHSNVSWTKGAVNLHMLGGDEVYEPICNAWTGLNTCCAHAERCWEDLHTLFTKDRSHGKLEQIMVQCFSCRAACCSDCHLSIQPLQSGTTSNDPWHNMTRRVGGLITVPPRHEVMFSCLCSSAFLGSQCKTTEYQQITKIRQQAVKTNSFTLR